MIAYLQGEIVEELEESIVVVTHGVGYEVFCSANTMDDFFGQKEVNVWVHTNVREDAITLFGFSSKIEKNLFDSLIKVNGIGPKMAVKILSGAKIDNITSMIESADAAGLAKLPKVGKKKAEQIILTLKGKLKLVDEQKSSLSTANTAKKQILSALTNLDFRSQDVETVLSGFADDISFEDGVREALAILSGAK